MTQRHCAAPLCLTCSLSSTQCLFNNIYLVVPERQHGSRKLLWSSSETDKKPEQSDQGRHLIEKKGMCLTHLSPFLSAISISRLAFISRLRLSTMLLMQLSRARQRV